MFPILLQKNYEDKSYYNYFGYYVILDNSSTIEGVPQR